MAATQATLGANTVVSLGSTASPPVYTEIPECLTIGAVGEQADLVEVTSLNSPNATREYISGLQDGDEKELRMNRIDGDTTQDALRTAAQAGNTRLFRILLPTGEQGDFSLTLLGWRIDEVDPNGPVVAVVNAKQTGPVTWTSPS